MKTSNYSPFAQNAGDKLLPLSHLKQQIYFFDLTEI